MSLRAPHLCASPGPRCMPTDHLASLHGLEMPSCASRPPRFPLCTRDPPVCAMAGLPRSSSPPPTPPFFHVHPLLAAYLARPAPSSTTTESTLAAPPDSPPPTSTPPPTPPQSRPPSPEKRAPVTSVGLRVAARRRFVAGQRVRQSLTAGPPDAAHSADAQHKAGAANHADAAPHSDGAQHADGKPDADTARKTDAKPDAGAARHTNTARHTHGMRHTDGSRHADAPGRADTARKADAKNNVKGSGEADAAPTKKALVWQTVAAGLPAVDAAGTALSKRALTRVRGHPPRRLPGPSYVGPKRAEPNVGCMFGEPSRSAGAAAGPSIAPGSRKRRLPDERAVAQVAAHGTNAIMTVTFPPNYAPHGVKCRSYVTCSGEVLPTVCCCVAAEVPRPLVSLNRRADKRTVFLSKEAITTLADTTRATLPTNSPLYVI